MRKPFSKQNMNNGTRAKLKSTRGFTMAEMITTVAIIIILAAVAFIALVSYQRSLAQKERDGIAREIFISAQNHLTMVRGEGYLDTANSDNKDNTQNTQNTQIGAGYTDTANKVNYFIVSNGDAFDDENPSILDLMLPFGAIEEGVRTGDSYIVRYQPETAEVMDVFYGTLHDSPSKFNHDLEQDDYISVTGLAGDENKSARRKMSDGSVLGWYGGEDLQNLGNVFKAPVLDVENSDTLTAKITDINTNSNAQIKLIVTGLTSGAKKGIDIKKTGITDGGRLSSSTNTEGNPVYSYVLDGITEPNQHFSELGEDTSSADPQKDKRFIAGEDIKVEAVAYSNSVLANLAYSNPAKDNSLYESISEYDGSAFPSPDVKTAYIANIRHLENLEEDISNTGHTSEITDPTSGKHLTFASAKQTKDLDLKNFVNGLSNKIYTSGADSATDHYYPVSYNEPIDYDGLRHSISNIKTSFEDNAGLFGITTQGSVKNLELIDFDIASVSGTGNAGALAGSLSGTEVSNVIAYNTLRYDNSTWSSTSLDETVEGTGAAGGLVGAMNDGSIDHAGAALTVTGSQNAGGLIGLVSGDEVSVNACFAGGHTQDGRYFFRRNDRPIYDISSAANGNSGGLIGNAGSAAITNCYSTCSAQGGNTSTGGLVGTASGSIIKCYSTGLVSGNNALIGSGDAAVTNSHYYEIINEENADETGVTYKEPGPSTGVYALDEDEDSYQAFVADDSTWISGGRDTTGATGRNACIIYDGDVYDYYDGRYNLMTVTQLESAGNKSSIADSSTPGNPGWYFVNHHYGDWPAPELFFVNN